MYLNGALNYKYIKIRDDELNRIDKIMNQIMCYISLISKDCFFLENFSLIIRYFIFGDRSFFLRKLKYTTT